MRSEKKEEKKEKEKKKEKNQQNNLICKINIWVSFFQ